MKSFLILILSSFLLFKETNCETNIVDFKYFDSDHNELNVNQIEQQTQLTVEMKQKGKAMFTFQLRKFRLSPNLVVTVQDEEGNPKPYQDQLKKECYFSGEVEGFVDSSATISFCYGVRGFFKVGNASYDLGYLPKDTTDNIKQATLHRVRPFKGTGFCGTKTSRPRPIQRRGKRDTKYTNKVLEDFRVVEVLVITDLSMYKNFSWNRNKLNDYVAMTVEKANHIYQKVNLFMVLKQHEMWTTVQPYATNVMEGLIDRMHESKHNRKCFTLDYDATVLIHNHDFGKKLGQAFEASVCDLTLSVAWVNQNEYTYLTLPHEVAHILGLTHDDYCEEEEHLMDSETGAEEWSQCSIAELEDALKYPKAFCLSHKTEFSFRKCGDGLVTQEEECDCGGQLETVCSRKCCDMKTCKYINEAKCAIGKCCDLDKCDFIAEDTKCGDSIGECDAYDVCNGKEATCPNMFKTNGVTECINEGKGKAKGYCHNGRCHSRDSACQRIYGKEVLSASDECYHTAGRKKFSSYGCGTQNLLMNIPCPQENAYCGLLVCDIDMKVAAVISPGSRDFIKNRRKNCTSPFLFNHINYAKMSYISVPEGTYCGDKQFGGVVSKICHNFECIDLDEFKRYGPVDNLEFGFDDIKDYDEDSCGRSLETNIRTIFFVFNLFYCFIF